MNGPLIWPRWCARVETDLRQGNKQAGRLVTLLRVQKEAKGGQESGRRGPKEDLH